MLSKRIIPCLDVKDGRVVKGVNFVNLRDAGDPVEIARKYSDEGADEICFLDITASHEERKTMIDVVERTAAEVFVPLTVGGGVRTIEDVRQMLLARAKYCLRAWTRTGRSRAMTSRSQGPSRGLYPYRSSLPEAPEVSTTSRK